MEYQILHKTMYEKSLFVGIRFRDRWLKEEEKNTGSGYLMTTGGTRGQFGGRDAVVTEHKI